MKPQPNQLALFDEPKKPVQKSLVRPRPPNPKGERKYLHLFQPTPPTQGEIEQSLYCESFQFQTEAVINSLTKQDLAVGRSDKRLTHDYPEQIGEMVIMYGGDYCRLYVIRTA